MKTCDRCERELADGESTCPSCKTKVIQRTSRSLQQGSVSAHLATVPLMNIASPPPTIIATSKAQTPSATHILPGLIIMLVFLLLIGSVVGGLYVAHAQSAFQRQSSPTPLVVIPISLPPTARPTSPPPPPTARPTLPPPPTVVAASPPPPPTVAPTSPPPPTVVATPSPTAKPTVGPTPPPISKPIVSAITPTSGVASGGISITIKGSGFTGASSVMFGSTATTSFNVDSDTQITAISPAGSGPVDITVTTSGGTSTVSSADQFSYIDPPTVSSISPMSGPAGGGTTVIINGSGFTGASSVSFGSVAATSFTVDSNTQITAVSPAGSGPVDITVTTPGGTSTTSSVDQFSYIASPVVSDMNQTSGPTSGGTTIIISGSGFTGASNVMFGSTAAASFTVDSDTQITAVSPAGSGQVDITVTTPGGPSAINSADQFSYIDRPTIVSQPIH